MRISTNQIFNKANADMLNNQKSLIDVQEKLTSGKKYNSLAEDPIAANRIIQLRREVESYTQMNENVDAATRRLDIEEAAMSDMIETAQRAKELAVQMGNASYGNVNYAAIARELEQLVSKAEGIVNTKDAKGEYLFSGTQGLKNAYQLQSGRYVFQGDPVSREVKVSNSMKVQTSDSGLEVFENISGTGALQITGPSPDGIPFHNIFDEQAFSAQSALTGGMTFTFTDNAGVTEVTVTDAYGNVVDDRFGNALSNKTVDPVLGFVALLDGANVLAKTPAAALPTTTNIKFDAAKDNIMNKMMNVIDSIGATDVSTAAGRASLMGVTQDFIADIDEALDSFSMTMSSIGGRLANLEDVRQSNLDYQTVTQKALSNIEDLDYAKASTDLAKSQTALEASYAAFSKIQNLSLFDYIR